MRIVGNSYKHMKTHTVTMNCTQIVGQNTNIWGAVFKCKNFNRAVIFKISQ